MATRNNLIETISLYPKAASTAFAFGGFVMSNGSGEITPLTPTNPVFGLGLQTVTSADTDYAAETEIPVDVVNKTVDRFLIEVTGTATSEMVGLPFDISAGSASVVDVGSAGTQFRLERFISATLCEFSVLLS